MFQSDAGDERRRQYDQRVLDEARMTGLYDDDIATVLCGRLPTEVVLPLRGEDADAYAESAVGELLVLYVNRWQGGPSG
ncbi:hypothetical protein [Methylobacterium sp. J-067]|uniref:hypothetical protein n=1 Tax=Methylobacterium sp. J-067 TaxID=2836648 RepID=UPI001FBB6B94|nr:hypothetical protein [Methylobacterium sp. J-067]MCJ2023593.1 hypothetical protein [Methylobacterium sp. J-067]